MGPGALVVRTRRASRAASVGLHSSALRSLIAGLSRVAANVIGTHLRPNERRLGQIDGSPGNNQGRDLATEAEPPVAARHPWLHDRGALGVNRSPRCRLSLMLVLSDHSLRASHVRVGSTEGAMLGSRLGKLTLYHVKCLVGAELRR